MVSWSTSLHDRALAALPTKDELRGMLAGTLQAPLRNLAGTLHSAARSRSKRPRAATVAARGGSSSKPKTPTWRQSGALIRSG